MSGNDSLTNPDAQTEAEKFEALNHSYSDIKSGFDDYLAQMQEMLPESAIQSGLPDVQIINSGNLDDAVALIKAIAFYGEDFIIPGAGVNPSMTGDVEDSSARLTSSIDIFANSTEEDLSSAVSSIESLTESTVGYVQGLADLEDGMAGRMPF